MLTHCTNFFSRGGFGMMMPMGLIWFFLFVVGGGLLWRAFMTRNQQESRITEASQQESAQDILLKEFAKGNLTEEEYLAKKKYMDQ